MSGAPHRLCWPPPLTSQSSPQLFCLFTAQMLASLQQRWLTVWHTPAFIHKDTRATRPRSLIAMEPFDPVPVRVFEPTLCTHPNQTTNTSLLAKPRLLALSGAPQVRSNSLTTCQGFQGRKPLQQAISSPKPEATNNLSELTILL